MITACAIIESPLELVSKPELTYKSRFLKITNEMEKDTNMLKSLIQYEGLKLSNKDPEWESKTTIEIGFYRDDFARNMKTLVLTYAG